MRSQHLIRTQKETGQPLPGPPRHHGLPRPSPTGGPRSANQPTPEAQGVRPSPALSKTLGPGSCYLLAVGPLFP